MMKKLYHCRGLYQYQLMIVGTHLQPKPVFMISLACNMATASSASSSHIQKYNCSFAKYCCLAL